MAISSSSSSSSSTERYGENIVLNGSFSGNANQWTLIGGFYYDSNSIKTSSSGPFVKKLVQYTPHKTNHRYIVSYTLSVISGKATSSVTLGGAAHGFGSTTGRLSTMLIPHTDEPLIISLSFYQAGTAEIDDVEVVEVVDLSTSSESSSSSSSSSTSTASTQIFTSSSSESSSTRSTMMLETSSTEIFTSSSSSLNSSSSSSTALLPSSVSSSLSLSSRSSLSLSSQSTQLLPSSASSSSTPSSLSSTMLRTSSSVTSLSSMSSSTPSSQSSSSVSSISSSSSYFNPYYDMPFLFEITPEKPIWSFAKYKDTFYAGTGPKGEILMSKNGETWSLFRTVEDAHAVKLFVWQDTLFIGTSPGGKIYVYNFKTSKFYPWVLTDDESVTAFAAFEDNLYAATSPNGYIYALKDNTWRKKFKIAGNGITDMVVSDGRLFIFSAGLVSPVVYSGETLSLMNVNKKPVIESFSQPKTATIDEAAVINEEGDLLSSSSSSSYVVLKPEPGENRNSVASNLNAAVEIFSFENGYFINRPKVLNINALISKEILHTEDGFYIRPPSPDYVLRHGEALAASDTVVNGLYFSGNNLYSYAGDTVRVVAQGKGTPIEKFVLAGDYVFYATADTVFVSKLPEKEVTT